MSDYDTAGVESTGTDGSTESEIDQRTVDALTRYMTVLPDYDRAAGAADLYMVVSDSGKEYLVDTREGACECPDHEYRGTRCIHQRRVAAATGELEIPTTLVDDVDPTLGDHADSEPGATAEEPTLAADGGSDIIEAEFLGGTADGESDESATGDDARPDDCDCGEWNSGRVSLPCWPCYRVGFEEPNPEATDDET